MTTTARKRLRSRSVTLGLTTLVAASLTGCGGSEADNQAVCVDTETEVRVDDEECDDVDDDYHGSGAGFYWYYFRAGSSAPPVGGRILTGTGTYDSSSLSGSTKKGGVSSSGGTIERGGWGGSKSSS